MDGVVRAAVGPPGLPLLLFGHSMGSFVGQTLLGEHGEGTSTAAGARRAGAGSLGALRGDGDV